jgi:diguanylate cyclase (GGDEF)-like protein
MNKDELIKQTEEMLSAMNSGKRVRDFIPLEQVPNDLLPFAEAVNKFVGDIVECQDFTIALSNGELQTTPPPRSNYTAGPLKELQSQFIGMSMNMKELSEGKVVSKLYYPGELFENYNKVITAISSNMQENDLTTTRNVSSWSYHQVLAAINQLTTMVVQYNNEGTLVFANMTAKNGLTDIQQLPNATKPKADDLLSYLGKFTSIIRRMKHHEVLGSRFPVQAEIHDLKTSQWYAVHTDVAHLTDGSIGIIHMIDDITEWKLNEQELRNEAALDPLTSVFTRKIGDKKFQEMINNRATENNCVGFIDLDGLKRINDNFGHTEGDFAIRTVAEILMTTVRETDVVVRYGGDEFLILFKDCMESDARHIISRMYDHLDEMNNSSKKPYAIQFSVGFTFIDKTMDDMAEIINLIDEKMYNDKLEKQRNQPE